MCSSDLKKLLIVQGMMHRLEIMHALDQIKSHTRPKALLTKLPSVLKLIMASNAVPLISTLLPVVFGKAKVSRFVRRLAFTVGAGATIMAIFKRWKNSRTHSSA